MRASKRGDGLARGHRLPGGRLRVGQAKAALRIVRIARDETRHLGQRGVVRPVADSNIARSPARSSRSGSSAQRRAQRRDRARGVAARPHPIDPRLDVAAARRPAPPPAAPRARAPGGPRPGAATPRSPDRAHRARRVGWTGLARGHSTARSASKSSPRAVNARASSSCGAHQPGAARTAAGPPRSRRGDVRPRARAPPDRARGARARDRRQPRRAARSAPRPGRCWRGASDRRARSAPASARPSANRGCARKPVDRAERASVASMRWAIGTPAIVRERPPIAAAPRRRRTVDGGRRRAAATTDRGQQAARRRRRGGEAELELVASAASAARAAEIGARSASPTVPRAAPPSTRHAPRRRSRARRRSPPAAHLEHDAHQARPAAPVGGRREADAAARRGHGASARPRARPAAAPRASRSALASGPINPEIDERRHAAGHARDARELGGVARLARSVRRQAHQLDPREPGQIRGARQLRGRSQSMIRCRAPRRPRRKA